MWSPHHHSEDEMHATHISAACPVDSSNESTARTNPGLDRADVVIVGARCAGAALARLLARAGHDVLVVDRASFPSETLSTHAIARGGVVQLHRWGLLDDVLASGAPPIRRVEFHAGGEPVVRTVKDRHGVDHLVAPRRHVLDPLLQRAAEAAGARLRTGTTVTGVIRDDAGRVVGVAGRDERGAVEVRARFVVGADGLKSRVARSVRAQLLERRRSSSATHYAYFAGDWSAMEYHLGDGSFAGVFPTHAGEACVWVCAPDDWALGYRRRTASIDEAFRSMVEATAPALAERLLDMVPMSTARGMMSIPNQIVRPFGDGWALVGDAGYHRDAITGHGISDAFRDAELLAVALDRALQSPADEHDALCTYQDERDRMLRVIFEITCELSEMPPTRRFLELQKQLATAIDRQAGELAERPLFAAEPAA
jgi:flavin-dependent dehydrogenase